ncbi:hypothetical protein KFL_002300100 [Klebsormidium nitens]|uniref:PROP1-like PPR domain-containing protein n=1 Tax=Klebsormidium nitens TaxID=105231 RepID=A0A1Y1IB63_KLENI|nr:hypothetical protein KFL_002300100 [Klebsormidium nitens]|eukprot:GAQ85338.1 hypothetical protein KFL_002300100 [Klebsormidium nitens]
MVEREALAKRKGFHGTVGMGVAPVAGSRPVAVHSLSDTSSDEGFRAAVQELSKPPAGATNGAPSPSSPDSAPSSFPDSVPLHQSEDDASVSSRTFTVEKGQSRTARLNGASDGSDEARWQSSRGASSSAPRDPSERWERGVVRQRRTVVDRWVSSDDEEDYLSRRPARYEKWDRSLASEYSNADRTDFRGRHRPWVRGARAPVSEPAEVTGGEEGDGQVATLQRRVPTELLAIVRKRRALEKAQQEGLARGKVSDVLKQASKSLDELEKGKAAQTGSVTIQLEGDASEGGEGGISGVEVQWGRRWRKAQEHGLQRSLSRQVIRLARRKQLDKVFAAVEDARTKGLQPDRKTLNAVIAACAHCGDPDRARDVFTEMVAKGGPGVNEIAYGALLRAYGAAGRVEEALRLLSLMSSPTAPGAPQVTDVHVATVLNACADAGDSLRARQLLESRGTRTTLAYNMLIKAHAKSATPLGALLIVDEMRAHGLALDRNTYNSLILACVNGDNMPRAWELLKEMKSRSKFLESLQLAPDAVTYTTLLRGVARPGALATVLRLAEEMHTSSPTCRFDRVAYGALLDACIKCGSPDTAESVLAEMEERGREDPKLRPGPYAFLTLMRAFAADGELERCEELREAMFSSRCAGWATVAQRQEADELCLEAAVASGYTGPAKRLLRTMKAVKEGRSLSQRATAALVRLYASEGFPAQDSFRLQPLKFRKDASPAARVVTRSLPVIPELMFVTEDKDLGEVAVLLEETPVVLVVRGQPAEGGTEFVGYLTKAELRGGDRQVAELMRPLAPPIAFDDPISHAATLLLQSSSEVLLVVETEPRSRSRGQETQPSNPPGGKALATVVGIVTRGQLFEGVSEGGASSGYQSDDESGLEMIKQDLSKRGAVVSPHNPEEVPRNPEEGRAFPWRSRLAQLFRKGELSELEGAESEGEMAVEDDLGLEMIRQDMMKLDGGPVGKKSGAKKDQKSRRALSRLAYLEGLDLDTDDLLGADKRKS